MFKKEEKKKTIKTQQEKNLLSSCVVNFCWFIFLFFFHQEPDLHPEPGLGDHQVPDRSLATVEGELLILKEAPFSFFPQGCNICLKLKIVGLPEAS